jgi:hypothetical protein
MKGKRFTDKQITYALRQAEGGTRFIPDQNRWYEISLRSLRPICILGSLGS